MPRYLDQLSFIQLRSAQECGGVRWLGHQFCKSAHRLWSLWTEPETQKAVHGSDPLYLPERQAGQLARVPRPVLFGPVTEEGRVCAADRLQTDSPLLQSPHEPAQSILHRELISRLDEQASSTAR